MLIQQVQTIESAIKRLQAEERAYGNLHYYDSTIQKGVQLVLERLKESILILNAAVATVKGTEEYMDEHLDIYGPTTPELVRRAIERSQQSPFAMASSPINSNHRQDKDATEDR